MSVVFLLCLCSSALGQVFEVSFDDETATAKGPVEVVVVVVVVVVCVDAAQIFLSLRCCWPTAVLFFSSRARHAATIARHANADDAVRARVERTCVFIIYFL